MASYLRIGIGFFRGGVEHFRARRCRSRRQRPALTEASKMMEQGIPVKAIEMIDAALSSGKLPPDSSAKALLMRAQAQEKLNKLAFALADYNSALWMEGLSAADKAKRKRARPHQTASSASSTEAAKKAAAAAARAEAAENTRTDPDIEFRSRSANLQRQPRQTSAPSSCSGIGSFFSGLFGSSEPRQEPQQLSRVAATVTQQRRRRRPQRRRRKSRRVGGKAEAAGGSCREHGGHRQRRRQIRHPIRRAPFGRRSDFRSRPHRQEIRRRSWRDVRPP